MAMAEKRARRLHTDVNEARDLLGKIVDVCPPSVAAGFADPSKLASLPFPSLLNPPERFTLDPSGHFQYMGRTAYLNFRRAVLGLYPRRRTRQLGVLPVRADTNPPHLYIRAALWGTMGSGKSFMLAALACDLISSFYLHSRDATTGFQKQRAIYVPDCQQLLSSTITVFHDALSMAYADDAETLARIALISDEIDVLSFAGDEATRGVLLYLIVDQVNALEPSKKDNEKCQTKKEQIRSLIDDFAFSHVLVESASANNENARQWHSNKKRDKAVKCHHGGLDDEEYKSWKVHFGTSTPLDQLMGDSELRVRDATGCVPLFLRCWGNCSTSLESAWENFISLPEIMGAEDQLKEFIESQLKDEAHLTTRLEMYSQFLCQGRVSAHPDRYDCRYLYVENGFGRCVCGLYRDLIAETLQKFHKSSFVKSEWGEAIAREVAKQSPNCSLLGFMVEQQVIAGIVLNGVPLYGKTAMRCTKVVYFKTGQEALLEVEAGCVLYVPHAFNYHRVDAVIREYIKSRPLYQASPPQPKDLLTVYHQLPLQVAGMQITVSSLGDHLHSESQFCSPKVVKVWHPGFESKDVGVWFIWYVLQSEIDKHSRDAPELFSCGYGEKEVKGRTRSQLVDTLHHVAILYPVEDYEPRLKGLSSTR